MGFRDLFPRRTARRPNTLARVSRKMEIGETKTNPPSLESSSPPVFRPVFFCSLCTHRRFSVRSFCPLSQNILKINKPFALA